MSDPSFPYDVFLSHSTKDKAVGHPLAERIRHSSRSRLGHSTALVKLPSSVH
jgi:hypothetical protein